MVLNLSPKNYNMNPSWVRLVCVADDGCPVWTGGNLYPVWTGLCPVWTGSGYVVCGWILSDVLFNYTILCVLVRFLVGC